MLRFQRAGPLRREPARWRLSRDRPRLSRRSMPFEPHPTRSLLSVWRGRRRCAYIAAATNLVPGAASPSAARLGAAASAKHRRRRPATLHPAQEAALSKAIAIDEAETAAHLLFARPATFMLSVAELGQ